jgi:hypothetical protein
MFFRRYIRGDRNLHNRRYQAIRTSDPTLSRSSQSFWRHITASAPLMARFLLIPCLPFSSALKMEAIHRSETSVDFYCTRRRYIADDGTLQHR